MIISSFNPLSIAWCRELAPQIPTGLLTQPGVEAEAGFTFARTHGHPWVLPFARAVLEAADGFVDRVHAAGLKVGTWVSDDPDEAVALMRAGVDAVTTNDPGRVVAARRATFGA